MAHRKVYASDSGRYGTRMLTAGDPLFLSGPAARAMVALGRASNKKPGAPMRRAPVAPLAATDDLPALREAYFAKTGKRAFNGWSAETLREKIAAA